MPMKTNNRLSIITTAIALIAALIGCSNANTGKTVEVENVKWNVAAFAVVPFDSVALQVAEPEAYGDILPLRYSYTREESTEVDEILKQNDSLLSAKGYAYQWVKYGAPDKMDLVILPATPLLEQEVEVTGINILSQYGDVLQVCFSFDEKRKWEEITSASIGNRIAICVNGVVLNAPQVNAPITQGACSVTVPIEEVPTLLPNVDLSRPDGK